MMTETKTAGFQTFFSIQYVNSVRRL